ncbi:hypothetical protein Y032_0005g2357 [Ancylostoma ceylanicum]|uniref:Uncharacterized protein n=1 Tax=Ancylostoma ceylanicum TaxID=53326 RepID=A0A016VT74_9BILA|nr:hypothetical protein Y032_0005g2357 [Ancylostoma ceylanicum]
MCAIGASLRLPLYSSRSIAVSVAASRRHWPLCVLIVGGASLAWVAGVDDTGDRPSPLSSTTATDRRCCRRQWRPTVAAVAAVDDTPSSIPIDDSGDNSRDKRGFYIVELFSMYLCSRFVLVNVFVCFPAV